LMSFMFGSFISGALLPKNVISLSGKSLYGVAVSCSSGFIYLGCIMSLTNQKLLALAFLACAMGMQNAFLTIHIGAVVRTTHVTGTCTDVGSTLGRITMLLLRAGCSRRRLSYIDDIELSVHFAKLVVMVTLLLSFLLGCYLGALGFTGLGPKMLLIPASLTTILGIIYGLFRRTIRLGFRSWQARRLEAEMDLVKAVNEEAHEKRGMTEDSDDESEEQVELACGMLHQIQNEVYRLREDRASDSPKKPQLQKAATVANLGERARRTIQRAGTAAH